MARLNSPVTRVFLGGTTGDLFSSPGPVWMQLGRATVQPDCFDLDADGPSMLLRECRKSVALTNIVAISD
jgi:hypothetical protein